MRDVIEIQIISEKGEEEDDAPLVVSIKHYTDGKIDIEETFVVGVELFAPVSREFTKQLHAFFTSYVATKRYLGLSNVQI